MVFHSPKTVACGEMGGGRKLPGEKERKKGGQNAGVEVREPWKSPGNQRPSLGGAAGRGALDGRTPDSAH